MRKETYDLKKAELEKTLAEVESTIRKAEQTLLRPDEFMRAAKAASEWFTEKVLIFSDITPGKKPWGGGEIAEKSLLNIKNLAPEEKRLTFAQLKSMLTRYVGASSKIKVWSVEKFIISGFLPPVTGPDSILTSSNVSIRGK